MTLRAPVLDLLGRLETHGLRLRSVQRETPGGALYAQPDWAVSEDSLAPSAMAVFQGLAAPLRAAIAGAALLAVSATLLAGSAWIRDLRLAGEAEAARTMLGASAAASARLRGLDQAIGRSVDVLALTGDMSRLLPDGVWLDQLIVEDGTVTLVGFGPSAADVTRLLATVPNLTDIRFASPVIRDNTQEIERFRISATLTSGPGR